MTAAYEMDGRGQKHPYGAGTTLHLSATAVLVLGLRATGAMTSRTIRA